ncbi:DUF2892 domain-containing protein [Halorientalis brevis]|uniref:DUF2892 domain-containing protein n=1 Tax=Halorientalis brevis TaxID=1126241 RepID=A0ABD6C8R7_9EURY|nr:DUF2892 domain-containing protein [Halorientalis brevis]
MALPSNVGGADRKLRAIVGVVLAVVAVRALERGQGTRGTVIWFAAVPILFTVFTRYCPLNELLGRDTCQRAAPDTSTETLRKKVPP